MKKLPKIICLSFLTSLTLLFSNVHAQQQQLHLGGDNDASLVPGSGMLQIGETASPNLVIDGNEILARNNGANSTLFLNIEGGDIRTGKDADPSNLWVTGFLRAGTDAENVRFKFHHETGMVSNAGGTATLNLNLPAGTSGTDLIMVQVTKEGPSSNLLPVSILTRNNFAVTIGEILPNGTVYHVGIIYVE